SAGCNTGVAAILVARQRAGGAQYGGAPAVAGGRRGGWRAGAPRAAGGRRGCAECRRGAIGPSGESHGRLRARTDSGGVETQSSADDGHGEGAGPGAKSLV